MDLLPVVYLVLYGAGGAGTLALLANTKRVARHGKEVSETMAVLLFLSVAATWPFFLLAVLIEGDWE